MVDTVFSFNQSVFAQNSFHVADKRDLIYADGVGSIEPVVWLGGTTTLPVC